MSFKSIVTWGAGFIGSNLVDRLVKEKHKVIVLDNFVSGKKKNLINNKKKDVKIIDLDISKNKNLQKYFNKSRLCFSFGWTCRNNTEYKKSKKIFHKQCSWNA